MCSSRPPSIQIFHALFWQLLFPRPLISQVSSGRAKYEPDQRAIVWRIRKFPGGTKITLSGEADLLKSVSKKGWSKVRRRRGGGCTTTVLRTLLRSLTISSEARGFRRPAHAPNPARARAPNTQPPIAVEFNVPMFTASGLHVRFLKVFEKSSYQTTKWVRCEFSGRVLGLPLR